MPTSILCFGEVLWDCTPKGLFLGGAPCNVAYHAHALGSRPVLVSAVGPDFLGEEIKRRLTTWGVTTDFIGTVNGALTGVVQVDLQDPFNPAYTIVDHAAWDKIPTTLELAEEARNADAIVFGSLALRHKHNQKALRHILEMSSGLKVFDVNFRLPFCDVTNVMSLAEQADLVKLNEDELKQLAPERCRTTAAASLSDTLGGAAVCVTCGSAGAGLWAEGQWYWCDGRPVAAVGDSVGAGDAFLASLVHNLCNGVEQATALSRSCRLAEFVAASDGATPLYTPAMQSTV